MASRLTRSWLFFSILENDFIANAKKTGCDVAVFDLEDSVLSTKKDIARRRLKKVNVSEFSCKIGIRINNIESKTGVEDLQECLKYPFSFIIHPKTTSPDQLRVIEKEIIKQKSSSKIVPIIETQQGLENSGKIVAASELITHIIFGSIDYLADLGILDVNSYLSDNLILQEASVQLSLLALKRKLSFIDCTSDFYGSPIESEKFRSECNFSKAIGAKGKVAIHPKHVPVINEVFYAVENVGEFIKELNEIIGVMKTEGRAVVSYNRRIVGPPYLKNAIKKIDQLTAESSVNKGELNELKDSINKLLVL